MNAAFREAANGAQKGVLAVCDEPLVSVDFRMTDVSTTIDASLTMVMGDDMVRAPCPHLSPVFWRTAPRSDAERKADQLVPWSSQVKVVAWYDNEWGYSQRVVDLAEITALKWE